jgi:hypothetical protein
MKKCFVISPIGADGTPTREHANDVFDYIIRPAMEQFGILAYRSDHMHERGKISDQMFRAILEEDLSIAVLTGYNPNVFYELAVAQCAARPVIILLEKDHPLPFDIKDLRCVYYDLKPRALFEQVYVKQLVEHVKMIDSAGWKASSPVSGLPLPGDGNGAGPMRSYPRSMDFGSPEAWLKMLKDTEHVFEVMGMALGSWKHGKGFSEVLGAKAQAGCRVRVLLCHPDNPSLPELINPRVPEQSLDYVLHAIAEMMDYFRAIARASPNVEVRQIRYGCPHFQLTRTDQVATAVHYLYSESTHYSPLCQYSPGSPLYSTLAQEFEALWQGNSETNRGTGQKGPANRVQGQKKPRHGH